MVNVASRMESTCQANHIQVSQRRHPLRARAGPLFVPPPFGREQAPVVASLPNPPPRLGVKREPFPRACGPSPSVPKPSVSEGRFADLPPPRGPDLVAPEG
eukprot:6982727-Pyramimonas_sp.AAC.1